MTEKQLLISIYQFIRLNPKRGKFYPWRKYKIKDFFLIQDIFKNEITNINYEKYNHLFYNKKKQISLGGQEYFEFFLNCKTIYEYNQKIRVNYPYCHTRKLHDTLIFDIFTWYLNDKEYSLILETEVNFNENTKRHLAKIRTFLKSKEWNYYFFDLQNLMHKTIIDLLDWKNKALNFNAYGKVLTKKLNSILQSETQVNYYLEIIQNINFYRNLLAKVAPVKQAKLVQWKQMNDAEKDVLAWTIYYSLVEFINFTILNTKKNKKQLIDFACDI